MNRSIRSRLNLSSSIKFVMLHATVVALTLATTSPFVASCMADDKRGMAGSQDQRENAMNVRWAYNWGNSPNHDVTKANYEFVPMIWAGSAGGVGNQINTILNLETNFGIEVEYVLGFNEPEREDQADMTVTQALATWEVMTEQFAGTGIKLVSPAPSGSGGINTWLRPFMNEVESRNNDNDPTNDLQVDEIAIHWYSTGSNPVTQANNILTAIDNLYEDYGRPIWLTEFAGVDFSGNASTENRVQFNHAFLDYIIPRLESRDHVTRYSWWQFGIGGNPYSQLSSVSGGVYTPTGIGDRYQGTLLDDDTYDFASGVKPQTDVHYLKGGALTNTGPALVTALRAIDALDGDSIFNGIGDYGFEDAEDAFIRVRNGATLRKQGGNTVTVSDSPVVNDGTMLVQGGSLQLENGSELTGDGTLRVDSNGILATAVEPDGDKVALNSQSIILNQGLLHVKDGLASISQELRFWNPSEVRTDGNLVVSGTTAGFGRILSTGSGTLFLSGEGLHQNGATVSEGALIVANTETSATGAGSVIVNGTGEFGGFGLVDGNMLVQDEGTFAPGIAESSSGATSAPAFDEGVVVNALNFDFTGIQDDAPLTQTSTLHGALQLVSGLDYGPGLQPRVTNNAGNEFNVSGFTTVNNWASASAAQDYLTFTVAPVEGLAMQLQEVSFELRRNGVDAARLYRIFTSIDGFNVWNAGLTPLTFVLAENDTNKTTLTRAYTGNEIVTEPIEVRIYGWNSNSSAGNTRFTNVSIDASFFSDPNSIAFDPTGILQLGGNYTQLNFATLKIDLGGTQAGEFDQLQVDGNVTLSGTLNVAMIDGFEGATGQTFDIITANAVTGTFDNVIAPEGMNVQVNYSNSGVALQLTAGLTGDFDGDNDVDVDDIDFYVGNIGSPANSELAQLDFNGDGQITTADLQIHVETYVQTSNGQTGTFLGDFNLDGTVDVLRDAFVLIGSLGSSVSSYADGDINLDGNVNVLGDAFVLIGNLGSSNAP